jgi:transposase
MRYDRMIDTILALAPGDQPARVMAWRQLVDIVAQVGDRLDPAMRAAAFEQIAALRATVPNAVRRQAAASLSGRTISSGAVALFAMDDPAVAAPVLAGAMLADAEWLALLPALPPASRAILRNRRDLSVPVMRALNSYGAADFALPSGAAP